jgi:DNA-binding MarR family transcriptional regulator
MTNARGTQACQKSEAEMDVLSWLLVMPFLDQQELASLAEWPSGTVYRAARRLERQGLVSSIQASLPVIAAARRLYLTMPGIEVLARARGVSTGTLLRRYPVSAHWLRLLLARLDAIVPVYRLAAMLAEVAGVLGFRWYRKLSLDAAFELDGGRILGVLREGRSAPPSHLGRRLRPLLHGRHPDTLLVIAPDPVRLRDWRRLLGRLPFTAFLALEQSVLVAGAGDQIWYSTSDPEPWPLARVVPLARGGALPTEHPPARLSPPPGDIQAAVRKLLSPDGNGRTEDHLLPVALGAAEKRVLDQLALWPWATRADLSGFLGVSINRMLQMLELPLRLGLVQRVRHDGRIRYHLSARGLKMLARRDRMAIPAMLKRWDPSPVTPRTPFSWRNVRGSRSRQLARHIAHTSAVYRFLAALAHQARQAGHELAHVDPPHRAARRYLSGGKHHSINPDAYGQYRTGAVTHHFFLEWERRAMHPALLRAKLVPYLRYYATRRPLENYGAYPVLLVVLKDEIVESVFLRITQEELANSGIATLRVLASHAGLVEARGPLTAVWADRPGGERRSPW